MKFNLATLINMTLVAVWVGPFGHSVVVRAATAHCGPNIHEAYQIPQTPILSSVMAPDNPDWETWVVVKKDANAGQRIITQARSSSFETGSQETAATVGWQLPPGTDPDCHVTVPFSHWEINLLASFNRRAGITGPVRGHVKFGFTTDWAKHDSFFCAEGCANSRFVEKYVIFHLFVYYEKSDIVPVATLLVTVEIEVWQLDSLSGGTWTQLSDASVDDTYPMPDFLAKYSHPIDFTLDPLLTSEYSSNVFLSCSNHINQESWDYEQCWSKGESSFTPSDFKLYDAECAPFFNKIN